MPLRRLRAELRAWLGLLLVVAALAASAQAMTPRRVGELRRETVDMFYHGFDNYMQLAFPEDEVRSACVWKREALLTSTA